MKKILFVFVFVSSFSFSMIELDIFCGCLSAPVPFYYANSHISLCDTFSEPVQTCVSGVISSRPYVSVSYSSCTHETEIPSTKTIYFRCPPETEPIEDSPPDDGGDNPPPDDGEDPYDDGCNPTYNGFPLQGFYVDKIGEEAYGLCSNSAMNSGTSEYYVQGTTSVIRLGKDSCCYYEDNNGDTPPGESQCDGFYNGKPFKAVFTGDQASASNCNALGAENNTQAYGYVRSTDITLLFCCYFQEEGDTCPPEEDEDPTTPEVDYSCNGVMSAVCAKINEAQNAVDSTLSTNHSDLKSDLSQILAVVNSLPKSNATVDLSGLNSKLDNIVGMISSQDYVPEQVDLSGVLNDLSSIYGVVNSLSHKIDNIPTPQLDLTPLDSKFEMLSQKIDNIQPTDMGNTNALLSSIDSNINSMLSVMTDAASDDDDHYDLPTDDPDSPPDEDVGTPFVSNPLNDFTDNSDTVSSISETKDDLEEQIDDYTSIFEDIIGELESFIDNASSSITYITTTLTTFENFKDKEIVVSPITSGACNLKAKVFGADIDLKTSLCEYLSIFAPYFNYIFTLVSQLTIIYLSILFLRRD